MAIQLSLELCARCLKKIEMMKKRIFITVLTCLWIFTAIASCKPADENIVTPSPGTGLKGELNKAELPQPVFSENQNLIDLYWKAWELAWGRVKYQTGVFQSPYMDENLWDDTIWIWDTEFMVLFCKYAPHIFPGIESLNNFYQPILNQVPSTLRIQHPDNPAFYSWVEYEYYKMTGDKEHIKRLLTEERFLQRHYYWFDNLKRGTKFNNFGHSWIGLEKRDIGYIWSWTPSGMDNTPRGRGRKGELLWMDALAQQATSALYITRLAEEVGDAATAREFKNLYNHNKELLNSYYWDKQDGFYYDLSEDDHSFVKVKTPTVYWAMLAEVADAAQAQRLAQYATDPNTFGGEYPWPSVSRDDPDYNHEIGDYWRGGIWLPLAYMATKALEKYGYYDMAYENSYKLLTQMYDTYAQFTPHTIWECYSPSRPRPSERQRENGRELVSPDFCGWSALGPISLFIENVIGFYNIDATNHLVEWRKTGHGEQGIKNLRFGDTVTDIVARDNEVTVNSNADYTLKINGIEYPVKAGNQTLLIP